MKSIQATMLAGSFLCGLSLTACPIVRAEASDLAGLPPHYVTYSAFVQINGSAGSGFYVAHGSNIWLITAAHVLFSPNDPAQPNAGVHLRGPNIALTSMSANERPGKIHLLVDAQAAMSSGNLRVSQNADVVALHVATEHPLFTPSNPPQQTLGMPVPPEAQTPIAFEPEVRRLTARGEEGASLGSINIDTDSKPLHDVIVGNEVVVIGFPASLDLTEGDAYVFDEPLIRKGVVAGIHLPKTIILDAPAYPGNSGGPAIEVDPQTDGTAKFRVIGVMDSFIPFEETWTNVQFERTNVNIENSGYSAIIPMDQVFPLLADLPPLPTPLHPAYVPPAASAQPTRAALPRP